MVFGIDSSIAHPTYMSIVIWKRFSALYNRRMGKFGTFLVFIIVIAVIAAGFLWMINSSNKNGAMISANSSSSASSNTVPTLVLNTPTGTAASGTESISDGTITIAYPGADFGLATSQTQVTVRSYIPPCDPDFNYCLYYIGTAYQGTNFDSAGIRVEKRADLTTQVACLTIPPTGFANFTPTSTTIGDYSVSEFTPLGDAGAGHFAKGALYRLEYNGSCYEFETRIGQSQFANYPSGTIQQFTAADEANVQTEIVGILNSITLPSSETVNFPQ